MINVSTVSTALLSFPIPFSERASHATTHLYTPSLERASITLARLNRSLAWSVMALSVLSALSVWILYTTPGQAFGQSPFFSPRALDINIPKDIQQRWGPYSPYFALENYHVPEGCEVTQVNVVSSHSSYSSLCSLAPVRTTWCPFPNFWSFGHDPSCYCKAASCSTVHRSSSKLRTQLCLRLGRQRPCALWSRAVRDILVPVARLLTIIQVFRIGRAAL